ncbi:MAG: hypothetical protein K1W36_12865 [Lachnospiraceae bacterium]|nr:hypothetical protein [Lachnospiraceae bacterium]
MIRNEDAAADDIGYLCHVPYGKTNAARMPYNKWKRECPHHISRRK